MKHSEMINNLGIKIAYLLLKHKADLDVSIYMNNNRLTFRDYKFIFNSHIDVSEITEYSNKHSITMTFEGDFYHALNYNSNPLLVKKFIALLKEYGYYYEMGNAWNLALYKI